MDERRTVALAGHVDAARLKGLTGCIDLDFSQVDGIDFAALRELLALREHGVGVEVVNASDDAFLTFESTGVSRFVRVYRRPRELDLSEWRKTGEGAMGDCLFSPDGDRMVKLYANPSDFESARLECVGARAAFANGVPTPLVGEEITSGGRAGIVFELARNKRSFARLVADDPANIECYAKDFSDLCLKLHATPCDRRTAPSMAERMVELISSSGEFTAEEARRAIAFVESVPETGTCLQGDLHLGNAIVCDAGPQFIDMGEFSYGNPLFDLAMTYFVGSIGTYEPHMTEGLYHITPETMRTFWSLFERFYFGAETPGERAEVEERLTPFVGLRALVIIHLHGKGNPFIEGLLRDCLIRRV